MKKHAAKGAWWITGVFTVLAAAFGAYEARQVRVITEANGSMMTKQDNAQALKCEEQLDVAFENIEENNGTIKELAGEVNRMRGAVSVLLDQAHGSHRTPSRDAERLPNVTQPEIQAPQMKTRSKSSGNVKDLVREYESDGVDLE